MNIEVRDQSRTFVNTGIKLRVPQKERIFLTFIVITSFLKEHYSVQLIISFIH